MWNTLKVLNRPELGVCSAGLKGLYLHVASVDKETLKFQLAKVALVFSPWKILTNLPSAWVVGVEDGPARRDDWAGRKDPRGPHQASKRGGKGQKVRVKR